MLADPCADPGIFARGVQARLPENSSDSVCFFCPQLLLFYSDLLMVYFKESYNFSEVEKGVQHFPGGPNFFQGGVKLFPEGWGVQMLILETHRTCDFLGGGANALSPSPLDPRM